MDWVKTSILEEGGFHNASVQSFYGGIKEHVGQQWRTNKYLHSYCFFIILFWSCYLVRPEPDPVQVSPNARAASSFNIEPVSIRPIYRNMKCTDVDEQDNIQSIIQKINITMLKNNYTCLAAIHVGIPLNIFIMNNETFINTHLIKQGNQISKAYETSAFFPKKTPKLMTRLIPITITEKERGRGTFPDASDAHCIMHMMEQMNGVNIYDDGDDDAK